MATKRPNPPPKPIIAAAAPTPRPGVPTDIPVVRTSNITLEARRRHRNSKVGYLVAMLSSIALLGVTGLVVLLYLDRNPQPNGAPQWTFRNPLRQGARSIDNNSEPGRPAVDGSPDSAAAEHSGALAPNLPDERRPVAEPPVPAADPRAGSETNLPPTIVVPLDAVTLEEDDQPLVESELVPSDSLDDNGSSGAVFSKRDAQVLGEALARARSNLGLRKWSAIQPHLDRARRHARLPHHREDVARLQRLHYYVTQFWEAVRQGLGRLDGGMEMPVKDLVVIVVEASEERLTLRANGKNRTFLVNELPGKLAMVMADQWFHQEAASTPLIKGAFMAVDPDFEKGSALEMIRSTPTRNQDVLDVIQAVADTYDFEDDVTPN